MRKIVFLAILCLVAIPAMAQEKWPIRTDTVQPASTLERLLQNRFNLVEGNIADLQATANLGRAEVFYVYSVTGADTYTGADKDHPLATLAAAVAKCTANRGDRIVLLQNHAESLTGSVAINIAGITIEGTGNGTDLPTFLYTDTDGALTVTAANVTIRGLRFQPGISAVVTAITLSAAADYFTLTGCEFVEPGTATYEFYDMVTLATGTDYCTIAGNKFVSTVSTAGCNQAIDVDTGIVDRLTIAYNDFQGNFAVAAVHSSRACTNALIVGNTVHQQTTGQFAIEFTAAATGICADNLMYSDSVTTTLDPGSLKCFENYAISTIDLSAELIPVVGAIGTVTAGSADDILKKLYYTSDGSGAYPATAANDSTISKIIAKGSTATASTFDNSTDSLEAISDAVRTSFAAFTNPNYLAVSTGTFDTTGTWSTVASHEIAVVTGMVRMLIIPECTATMSSASDTGTIALGDETTTNSIIAASTIGSGLMATGELWVDATLTRTILTQTQLNAITFVVANGKDIGYTVATNALTGGSMKFHIWWVPLDSTGAVTAGAGGGF